MSSNRCGAMAMSRSSRWTASAKISSSGYPSSSGRQPRARPQRSHPDQGSGILGIPLHQAARIGTYLVRQHLSGRKRYPLVLMLEPLFRCNLACAGCGKIDYPSEILDQRLPYDDCMTAIDECGAPVASIAGGEPLWH